MKNYLPKVPWTMALVLVLGFTLTAGSVLGQDDDLEGLLSQVGQDYAEAYSSPFIEAFGPNMNSAMYQSAKIPWFGLTFGIGVKFMGTYLNESDQTFQKTSRIDDLGDLDPGFAGIGGTAIFSGPTMFGSRDVTGTVTLVPDSGGPPISLEGIPGLIDSRFVPMFAPEAYVGGLFGFKGTIRYFPEIDLDDYGKTKYFGWGIQWSPNGLLNETFPVDLMIGFFDQGIDVGTLINSSATSYFIAVSKSFSLLTPYVGFAIEDSKMNVSYIWEETGDVVSFDAKALQESRFTIGLKIWFANLEMGYGKMATYSAGIMFGI